MNDFNNYEILILFFIIIFSWILIDLYGKVINNYVYITLGMDENSTWNALILAVGITIIFFLFVYFLGDKCKKKIIDISPDIITPSENDLV